MVKIEREKLNEAQAVGLTPELFKVHSFVDRQGNTSVFNGATASAIGMGLAMQVRGTGAEAAVSTSMVADETLPKPDETLPKPDDTRPSSAERIAQVLAEQDVHSLSVSGFDIENHELAFETTTENIASENIASTPEVAAIGAVGAAGRTYGIDDAGASAEIMTAMLLDEDPRIPRHFRKADPEQPEVTLSFEGGSDETNGQLDPISVEGGTLEDGRIVSDVLDDILGEAGIVNDLFADVLGEGGYFDAILDGVIGQDGIVSEVLDSFLGEGGVLDDVLGDGGAVGAVLDDVLGEDGVVGGVLNSVLGEHGTLGGTVEVIVGGDSLLTDIFGNDGIAGDILDPIAGEGGVIDNVLDPVLGGAVDDLLGEGSVVTGLIDDLAGEDGFVDEIVGDIPVVGDVLGSGGLLGSLLGGGSAVGGLLGLGGDDPVQDPATEEADEAEDDGFLDGLLGIGTSNGEVTETVADIGSGASLDGGDDVISDLLSDEDRFGIDVADSPLGGFDDLYAGLVGENSLTGFLADVGLLGSADDLLVDDGIDALLSEVLGPSSADVTGGRDLFDELFTETETGEATEVGGMLADVGVLADGALGGLDADGSLLDGLFSRDGDNG